MPLRRIDNGAKFISGALTFGALTSGGLTLGAVKVADGLTLGRVRFASASGFFGPAQPISASSNGIANSASSHAAPGGRL